MLYLLLSVLSTSQVSCAGAHEERSYGQMSLGGLSVRNPGPHLYDAWYNNTLIRDSVTEHRQGRLAMDEE